MPVDFCKDFKSAIIALFDLISRRFNNITSSIFRWMLKRVSFFFSHPTRDAINLVKYAFINIVDICDSDKRPISPRKANGVICCTHERLRNHHILMNEISFFLILNSMIIICCQLQFRRYFPIFTMLTVLFNRCASFGFCHNFSYMKRHFVQLWISIAARGNVCLHTE